MRCVIFMLLSVALLVSAGAQAPADREAPTGPPVIGQAITIEDLRGVLISVAISYAGRTRWSGDNVVRPIQFGWRIKAQIRSAGNIDWSNDTSTRIGNDKWYPMHYSFSDMIGRPNTKPEIAGAPAVVWTFEDNTLTLLRVFEKGGRVTKITVSRVGSSLNCTATSSFVNEAGAGNPTIKAPILGGYREYIGMNQTSSTCGISKN